MGDLLVVLIVVLIVVLLWRGPKTLPRIGEALGRGVREARIQAAEAARSTESASTTEAASTSAPGTASEPGGTTPPPQSPDGDRRP